MFLAGKPSEDYVQRFVAAQSSLPFSYKEVGATRSGVAPAGYTVDHNRVRLGTGEETFEAAARAVREWKMFDLGWVQILWSEAPIEIGTTVGVLAGHFGFWSLNAARIVYTVDDDGPVRRYGFAYGTLPEHVEDGEERFTVEWNREDNSVWYDLFSFARGSSSLIKAGYPVRRSMQRRFGRDSKEAMVRAVSGKDPR